MKDCDPNTGEADEEGYDDEYVVCIFQRNGSGGVFGDNYRTIFSSSP